MPNTLPRPFLALPLLLLLVPLAVFVLKPRESVLTDEAVEDPVQNRFSLMVETPDGRRLMQGETEFDATPSSFSVTMADGENRCVLHMLNYTSLPGPGTYPVGDADGVRTAMVCLLGAREPLERLASVSGRLILSRLDAGGIRGRFEMALDGPTSGLRFRVSGELESVNTALPLRFGS